MIHLILSFIRWNIDPTIFEINIFNTTIPINWYGLFFAISFIVGQRIFIYIFKQEEKPFKDVETLTLYVVIATVLGARLGHYIFYEWEMLFSSPVEWFITLITPPFAGLASHGAAIAILIALYLYSRKKPDQSFFWVVDRVVIAACSAGFIRVGNLFNSEIYGEATTMPWGFLFLRETDPGLLPVVPRHPTQIYEALFCLVLFFITFYLWKNKRKKLAEGVITGVFIAGLFLFRFFVEFLKNEQASFEEGMALNMGQILSIPFVIIGVAIIIYTTRQKNNRLAD